MKRSMSLRETRRRINALQHHDNVGYHFEWTRWVAKACRSLIINRWNSVRTVGLVVLSVALLVLLVWVGWRYFPSNNDLKPVQVPEVVVSDSLVTVDLETAEPDPARLQLGSAVLEQGVEPLRVPEVLVTDDTQTPHLSVVRSGVGSAVLEQGVELLRVPEVLVTDDTQTPHLSVVRSGVGIDVVDRELVGRSDSFAIGAQPTFWTHVTGGRVGDIVRHVWFHENRTVGVINLTIESSSWRTYSRRLLTSGAEGDWVVEVWDMEGRVLARHEFHCESRRISGAGPVG